MISKDTLYHLYVVKKYSTKQIADTFKCSENKVNYWLKRHEIVKRSISDAMYAKHNPQGHPFKTHKPTNLRQALLLGLGIGLYWRHGSLTNNLSVRLTSKDPRVIKKFMLFLMDIFHINKDKLRFGLQIPPSASQSEAISFWERELTVGRSQFQKVTLYKVNQEKPAHAGVMTLYYHNKKLRDVICKMIENV